MTDSANSSLRRNLQARHLTMIAIGGSIGTGLFVASGATISMAGPGGALLAYGIIGLMVYFLMTSLGELAAFMPESGSLPLTALVTLIPRWALLSAGTIGTTGLLPSQWTWSPHNL